MENGWEYSIELPVPVAPGEIYEITTKDTWSKWAKCEDDHWFTRHHILHTVEGIYTLTFVLPEGAKFSSAMPQTLRQFDFNGKPTVTWKRYMPADEDATFEARYKL